MGGRQEILLELLFEQIKDQRSILISKGREENHVVFTSGDEISHSTSGASKHGSVIPNTSSRWQNKTKFWRITRYTENVIYFVINITA